MRSESLSVGGLCELRCQDESDAWRPINHVNKILPNRQRKALPKYQHNLGVLRSSDGSFLAVKYLTLVPKP